LKEQPGDFKAFDAPGFGDQLFVKYLRGGRWSEPLAVTGGAEDLVRCALAVEGDGTAWVAYSANRKGRYDVYARSVRAPAASGRREPAVAPPRLGAEQRLTGSTGDAHLNPVLCTDQGGAVVLACQSWLGQTAYGTSMFTCRGGKWTEGPYTDRKLSAGRNCW